MQRPDEKLTTAKRRRYVLSLRRQGATYEQIADKCLQKWGAEALPNGWDRRYAYKDVKRELERVREEVEETAEDVLELELGRLNEMLTRIYPVALGDENTPPDPRAVDRVLKIMKRRAKLLGLDEPERFEHSGPDGEPMQMQWVDPASIADEDDSE